MGDTTEQSNQEETGRVGEGQRPAGLALGSCESGAMVGSGPGAGTQNIRFLEDALANESLDAGGRAGDLSPGGELGLRRHTLSYFSI